MKEKILLALKAKFPAVNFTKKRLDDILAKLEKKIGTDETLIDAKIDEFDEYSSLADIAKNDDQLAYWKKQAKSTADQNKKEDEVPPADETNDDTPKWAKDLIASNKKLQTDLATIQGEERLTTIKQKAAEKLKDVPATFWRKWSTPDKEEDLEAFEADVRKEYAEHQQELTDKGLSGLPAPRVGVGNPVQGVVSPEIKQFVASQAAKQQQAATAK